MNKVFALLLVGVLFSASVYAQTASGDPGDAVTALTDGTSDDGSAVTDAASSGKDDSPSSSENSKEGEDEGFGINKFKQWFIDGGPLFMSIVLIALILGLAMVIERIIYLTLSTTNNERLLARVESALNLANVYIEFPEGMNPQELKSAAEEHKATIAEVLNTYSYNKDDEAYNYAVRTIGLTTGKKAMPRYASNNSNSGSSWAKVMIYFRGVNDRVDESGQTLDISKALDGLASSLNKVSGLQFEIENDGIANAKNVCRNSRGPVASIIYGGLEKFHEGADMVDKSIVSVGSVENGKLERGVSWVALFIALAPMLGFMGTVIGMIEAFEDIQAAEDISPAIVADGIKKALLTTVFGLVVAIILQVFYNLIISMIDNIVIKMEDASISFLDILNHYRQNKAN